MIIFDRHRRARKNMSAYVDGELRAKDADAFEAHVETCERCRLELEQLRATVTALQELPEVTPRRSFALTPDMLKPARPVPAVGPSPTLVQGMRLTAAGLAAALALVFVIDVSDSGTSDGDDAGGTSLPAAERSTQDSFDAGGGDGGATSVPDGVQGLGYGGFAPAKTADPMNLDVIDGETTGGAGGVGEPDSAGGEEIGDGLDDAADGDSSLSEGDHDPAGGADAGDEPSDLDTAGDDTIGGNADQGGEVEELTSLSTEDSGGFDTLLALEIALGAALVAAIAGAIWVGAAARRNSIGG